MRASPAFSVVVERFGVWRVAVALLVMTCFGVIGTWAVQVADQHGSELIVGVGLATCLAGLAALWSARMAPVELRWDGRVWRLRQGPASAAEPPAGELRVVLDLGPWMLLRFASRAPTGRSRIDWVPVQRLGLEAHWHGLRCAVHAPVQAGPDTS
jgi:hypothetical protein